MGKSSGKKKSNRWGSAAGKSEEHDRIKSAAEPGTGPAPPRIPSGKGRKIARRYTWGAFKALAAVMDDQDAAATARVNAANTILEWGHGKRGDSAAAPTTVEKVVKIDWGEA